MERFDEEGSSFSKEGLLDGDGCTPAASREGGEARQITETADHGSLDKNNLSVIVARQITLVDWLFLSSEASCGMHS